MASRDQDIMQSAFCLSANLRVPSFRVVLRLALRLIVGYLRLAIGYSTADCMVIVLLFERGF